MAIKVNSENLNRKRKIDLSKIEKAAKAALKLLRKKNAEVNIIFLSSQKIRVFNRAYLNKDAATDVIAFPGEGYYGPELIGKAHSKYFLGDIAISSDKAFCNAKIYGLTFTEEIVLYVIHGILHITGYEDITKKGREKMRRKEDELFKRIKEKKLTC